MTPARQLDQDEMAGSDQAHLASYYVDKLRDLVDMKQANNPTDVRDARVILMGCPFSTRSRLHIQKHRSELEHHETTAVFTDAFLSKESRPRGLQFYREYDE